MTLHAMQYFMTTSIVILGDSSMEVLNNLARPRQLEYTHNPNLRLVNIQIKHVMYILIKEMYPKVLDELEKGFCEKNKLARWAPSFCCVMILCMCAEMVQTNTDLRIVNSLDERNKLSTSGPDANSKLLSRDKSIESCRKIDDLRIASMMDTFQFVYKTHKYSSSKESFSLVCNGLDAMAQFKLGRDVEELVNTIRNIVAKHRECIC
jgi:hypothetical protein